MSDPVHTGKKLACNAARGPLIAAVFLAVVPSLAPREAGAQGGERSGKDVVESLCVSCHGAGLHGAPRIGDRKAWSRRATQGLTSLTQNALKGIRQMPAHGGNPALTDLEIGRAVTYMVNRSGGNWIEPASAQDMIGERSGEEVVKAQCAKCHQRGEGGAPRIGDRNAWIPRMKQGIDYLARSAIRGHGGMPPRGGAADLTDSEIRNAVSYLFDPAAARAGGAPGARGAAYVEAAGAAAAGPNHKTVGGMDIYLGFQPAESLLAYPEQSVERKMHGGVPKGRDYYHVNVALVDSASSLPIGEAHVVIQVEQPGLSNESKVLQPMAIGAASYGAYLRMQRKTPYLITVRVQPPGSSRITEARFEHRHD